MAITHRLVAATPIAKFVLPGGAIDPHTVFYHYGKGHDATTLRPLTFFTADKKSAESYKANGAGTLHAVYLDIKHAAMPKDVLAVAKKMGFDAERYLGMSQDEVTGFEYLSPHLNKGVAESIALYLKRRFDGAYFPEDFDLGGRLIPGGSVVIFNSNQVRPVPA